MNKPLVNSGIVAVGALFSFLVFTDVSESRQQSNPESTLHIAHEHIESGNIGKAVSLLEELSADGHSAADITLGVIFESEQHGGRDFTSASRMYNTAAEAGNALGYYHLGKILNRRDNPERDEIKAYDAMKLAADSEIALAQYELAKMIASGLGGSSMKGWEKTYFSRAAKQGFPLASLELAMLFHENSIERKRFLLEAAAGNIPEAMYQLYHYFRKCAYTKCRDDDWEDIEEREAKNMMMYWLQEAASHGHEAARKDLNYRNENLLNGTGDIEAKDIIAGVLILGALLSVVSDGGSSSDQGSWERQQAKNRNAINRDLGVAWATIGTDW